MSELIWVKARGAEFPHKWMMPPEPPPNDRLRRYRARAAHFWRLAASVPDELAREVWLSYASFWQEQAAKREDHLARRKAFSRDDD